MTADFTPEKRFLRGPAYLFLGLGFLAMYLGVMPAGIIGAASLLLPLALILEPLGERVPILKDYLGGSPLLLIFFGASLVHFKVLSPQVVESLGNFMKESGSNFLDFFICSLITGAIFGIVFTDLGQVAQAITPYYVFMCALVVIGAALGAGLVGRLVGFYFVESALTAVTLHGQYGRHW